MNSGLKRNGELPPEVWHRSHRGDERPKFDRFGISLSTRPHRWEEWIVKLSFEKLGAVKYGSGFYVNIPNNRFDVIFTAGHNLVEKPQQYCSNIRIISGTLKQGEVPVTPDMIRVRQEYFRKPDESSAVHDYGVIVLDRKQKIGRRGFGFHLMLGLPSKYVAGLEDDRKDVLQDRWVYVSGYRPIDTDLPRRSEGKCDRPNSNQLTYKADTEPGMSGGPVWIGFRGVETVVGIHNYGPAKRGQGNRGTCLSLEAWRTIFGWLGVGSYGKSLHYCGSQDYSMHLHLSNPSGSSDAISSEGQVRVGKPGRVDTLFDILPIAMQPDLKESNALFSFLLKSTIADAGSLSTEPAWVKWDPKKNMVSYVRRFDERCEVKLPQLILQPGKPFAIQALDGHEWKQVRMAMEYLDEADLEMLEGDPELFEDTPEISFTPVTKHKLFELRDPQAVSDSRSPLVARSTLG